MKYKKIKEYIQKIKQTIKKTVFIYLSFVSLNKNVLAKEHLKNKVNASSQCILVNSLDDKATNDFDNTFKNNSIDYRPNRTPFLRTIKKKIQIEIVVKKPLDELIFENSGIFFPKKEYNYKYIVNPMCNLKLNALPKIKERGVEAFNLKASTKFKMLNLKGGVSDSDSEKSKKLRQHDVIVCALLLITIKTILYQIYDAGIIKIIPRSLLLRIMPITFWGYFAFQLLEEKKKQRIRKFLHKNYEKLLAKLPSFLEKEEVRIFLICVLLYIFEYQYTPYNLGVKMLINDIMIVTEDMECANSLFVLYTKLLIFITYYKKRLVEIRQIKRKWALKKKRKKEPNSKNKEK